jgi:hypothetical protein
MNPRGLRVIFGLEGSTYASEGRIPLLPDGARGVAPAFRRGGAVEMKKPL